MRKFIRWMTSIGTGKRVKTTPNVRMHRIRVILLSFAAILALQALWLVSAEVIRPSLPYFPSPQTADIVATKCTWADRAATIAFVRGELWTETAVACSADILAKIQDASDTAKDDPVNVGTAHDAAFRGAQLSPHDSRAWLVLAALALWLNRPDLEIAGPLKMSYLTGPGEAALVPLRLRVATRSIVIEDDELQVLATQDLRTLVIQRPQPVSEIISAYRVASPPGRRFMEAAFAKLDPNLLRMLTEAR
jgi:hypothetical protein